MNVVAKPIFILLDFVEGTCSDDFAKNMIDFLESFRFEYVHLIVLGQESIFRRLSVLQRESLKIPAPIYMTGWSIFRKWNNRRHEAMGNEAAGSNYGGGR
ncbi:hypothetical protein RDV78_06010 [Bacillota bacterium LX-D]|nr:hypothetical protein [Bacillota bacterium LX-D]